MTSDATTNRWRALAVCQVALFATLIDVSVTNVALPSIGRATDATPSQLQWIVTGYVLAFGLVPVLAGRLGDDRGRRSMFLIGVGGFVVASAIVGISPDPKLIIVARVVQGLFGGLINPQVSGIVQQLFSGAERGRAFGAIGATVGTATAVGPLVGGLLIGIGGPDLGWRLVFFINVPIGLTAMVLAWRWLPARDVRRGPPPRLDVLGAALLGLTTLCVLFPTVQYDSVRDARLFWLLLPAVPLAAAFVRREWRLTKARQDPLVDLRLFRRPSYTVGVGLALLFFCGFTGLPLVLALYYQLGLGFTALQSGLGITAFAVGSATAAPLAGRLVPRFGRPLVIVALGVFAAGALAIDLVVRSAPVTTDPLEAALRLSLPLLLLGIGAGAIITPNQALSLADVDPRMGGAAGGVLQTAQRIGSAVGQAVIGSAFFAALAAQGVSNATVGTTSGPTSVKVSQAYASALSTSVLVTLLFIGAALVLGVVDLTLTRRRNRTPNAKDVPIASG
ncbi:MFS transporter [Angustibacter luteus]|uniref:MFS transporter n=1 Tax=Angustibacter luteus TaxID=658456 RepID=A0ABW1JFA1_9ACTN